VEILFRLTKRNREELSRVIFPKVAAKLFFNISVKSFEEDLREFRNILNKSLSPQKIFSFFSKKIVVDEKTYNNLWLYFGNKSLYFTPGKDKICLIHYGTISNKQCNIFLIEKILLIFFQFQKQF